MNNLRKHSAILKFINGNNDSFASMKGAYDYITDKAKTNGGKLVATIGCSLDHPIDDMRSNKLLHNKTAGKQYVNFIYAPSPYGVEISPEKLLDLTCEIVEANYPSYMAVVAVHTDSMYLHAHGLIDTVSAVDGQKLSQSPADLNRNKQVANNILYEHGQDVITESANNFVDHNDYSSEKGFNYLELDWSKYITESNLNVVSSCNNEDVVNDLWDNYNGYNFFNPNNNYRGGNYMINNNKYVPNVQPKMQASPAQTTTVGAVPTTPIIANNGLPNTTVVVGPVMQCTGSPESNFSELSEPVSLAAQNAIDNDYRAANLALTIQARAQQMGCPTNVNIIAAPVLVIDKSNQVPEKQYINVDYYKNK